jgi:hypothetical protein
MVQDKEFGSVLNLTWQTAECRGGKNGGGGTTFSLEPTFDILDSGCLQTTLHANQQTEKLTKISLKIPNRY